MKYKTSTKYRLIANIVFLVVLIFGTYFMHSKIMSMKESVADNYKVIASLREDTNVLLLQQELQSNRENVDKLLSYIVTKDNVVSYVELLENAGNANGASVTIENIDLEDGFGKKRVVDEKGNSQIKDVRTYGELKVKLKVEGSWQEVMSFVATIENLKKSTEVEDMRISSVFENGNVSWVANLVIRALTT